MATKRVVREETQDDFSGGVLEQYAPEGFSGRSMAVSRGFVLDSVSELRSQWACQKVGTQAGFEAVKSFFAGNTGYLVAIATDGSLWWCKAPAGTDPNTVTAALTWTAFDVTANTAYRFLTDSGTYIDGTGIRYAALLIHSATGTAPGLKIYRTASGTPFYGESFQLVAAAFTGFYPADVLVDATPVVSTGNFPRANTGTVLKGRLFLGDTFYTKTDSAFTSSNSQRFTSGVWFSEGDDQSRFFGNSYLYAASPDAQIRGMHVLDDRLIIITTSGPESDGVVTAEGDFRGPALRTLPANSSAAVDYANLINQRVLRGNLGAPRQTVNRHRNYSSIWPQIGSVVFIDRLGTVWSTEGSSVDQIDLNGFQPPVRASQNDHVAAMGRHLFVSRGNQLVVATVLQTDTEQNQAEIAWTELVHPGPGQVMSMTPQDDCLYFLVNGQPYRYALEGPALSERGLVNGAPVTLTFATRTVGDPETHSRKLFLQYGVSCRGIRNAVLTGSTFLTGPALQAGTVGYPAQVTPVPVGPEYTDWWNAGVGNQKSASAVFTFTGDLLFNEFRMLISGMEPDR